MRRHEIAGRPKKPSSSKSMALKRDAQVPRLMYHFVSTKLGGARWVVILSGTGR